MYTAAGKAGGLKKPGNYGNLVGEKGVAGRRVLGDVPSETNVANRRGRSLPQLLMRYLMISNRLLRASVHITGGFGGLSGL
jgi:hypothetical protein